MEKATKIWFITGVSGGLGRALAKEVATMGDTVIGTLRKEAQLEEFNQLVPGKTHGVLLDVTKFEDINSVLSNTTEQFGRIDVLVNNAGYGLFAAVEEATLEETRAQMETNFFGALAVTQAILPQMRQQGSGHIVQISSIAGINANPGLGIYNASKFALEGFSEALYKELIPLKIHVTLVEPGPFRTDWAGQSSARAAKIIDAYAETAGKLITTINGYDGQQPGDPVKAAKAIIKAVSSENPPLRLPLGKVAIDGIRAKLKSVTQNVDEWEAVGLDTAFDD